MATRAFFAPPRFFSITVAALSVVASSGCGSASSDAGYAGAESDSGIGGAWGDYDGGTSGPWGGSDSGSGGKWDASPASDTGGSFGSIGTGGSQDFAAFRKALDDGRIPDPASLDAAGFFAEHYTTLPAPTCGKTFCLHGMLSVSDDLARGGTWTLLQMGMNSPIDPSTVTKPPLDIAVVLDHSGSMGSDSKMEYARQGVDQLIDALTDADTLTVLEFDDVVKTVFGPAKVTDKASLKSIVDAIVPGGGTNIYDGLEQGYEAALAGGDETQQRRVILLTDGVATAGTTDSASIETMSAGYNEKYVGLTTIGLGSDADNVLLRSLAEKGGGNFYFVESPAAVTEVFTEELAFFVAPIAYDLDLTFTEAPSYSIKEMFGTNLWTAFPAGGGGVVHVPSVFLVSRTSTAPDPTTGGRRGGGSAIIANLTPGSTAPTTTPYPVGSLKLRYRLPGTTTYEEQTTDVTYDGVFGAAPPAAGFYSDPAIETNTVILDLFVAFRDATKTAQTDPKAALAFLQAFQPKIVARLSGWTDEDLLDDLKILQEYIDVLKKVTGTP